MLQIDSAIIVHRAKGSAANACTENNKLWNFGKELWEDPGLNWRTALEFEYIYIYIYIYIYF